jgi:hypothetical protein
MSTISQQRIASIRVWAADVRDQADDTSVSELASSLCHLIDLHGRIEADNVRLGIETSIALLIGKLALTWAGWPGK